MPDHPDINWIVNAPSQQQVAIGDAPKWCEVIVQQRVDGAGQRAWPTTREGAERLIESLHAHLHVNSGTSITQQIWAELDAVMDRLMAEGEYASDKDKGEALGLARALAHLTMPYRPSVKNIRTEAKRRWEARQ